MKKLMTIMMIMLVSVFTFTSCEKDENQDIQGQQDIVASFEFDSYTSGVGQDYESGAKSTKAAVVTEGIDRGTAPKNVPSITIYNQFGLTSSSMAEFQNVTYTFGDAVGDVAATMKLKAGYNDFTASAIQNPTDIPTGFLQRSTFETSSAWNQDAFYKDYVGVCLGQLDATQVIDIAKQSVISTAFNLTYADVDTEGRMLKKIGMRMTPDNSILTVNFSDFNDALYLEVVVTDLDYNDAILASSNTKISNVAELLLNTADFKSGKRVSIVVNVKEVDGDKKITSSILFNSLTNPNNDNSVGDGALVANKHYFVKANNEQNDTVKDEKTITITNDNFMLEGKFVVDWVTAFKDAGWNWEGFGTWN